MKMILSTMTAPQTVCITAKAANGSMQVVKAIEVKGGANCADKRTLVTPQGVITELTDEDYEELVKTDVWKSWLANGYAKPVEDYHAAEDTAKEGLEFGDGGVPPSEADFGKGGNVAVGDKVLDASDASATPKGRRAKAKGKAK